MARVHHRVNNTTNLGNTIRGASHKLDEWGELTADATDSLLNRAAKAAINLKGEADEYSNEFVGYVKRHPVKSAFIATGIGVVLGLIFRK